MHKNVWIGIGSVLCAVLITVGIWSLVAGNKISSVDSKNTSSITKDESRNSSSISDVSESLQSSESVSSSEIETSSGITENTISSSHNTTSTSSTYSTNTNQKKWSELMISTSVKAMKEYYVSPNGSDLYEGTKERPFKSLEYAKAVAAKFKNVIDSDMTIYLAGGEYRLLDTIKFDEEAFTAGDHKVIFKAISGQTPLISGGKSVNNWQPVTLNGINMYKAKVSGAEYVRQFYVNDESQPRAALEGKYNWNFKSSSDKTGITVQDVDLSKIQNPSSMEAVWQVEWKLFIHVAKSVSGNTIKMQEPYFKLQPLLLILE